jgi:hypothetical protein
MRASADAKLFLRKPDVDDAREKREELKDFKRIRGTPRKDPGFPGPQSTTSSSATRLEGHACIQLNDAAGERHV